MISSPYVWAKSGDSLLTNRTWQEWWAAPRLLGHKRLWFPSCSYSLWLFSQACSGGEGHTTEKKGCPLPIDSNELRLCLTADEEANPTKKHWVGLGADSAPAELEMLKFQLTTWLQTVRDSEAWGPAKPFLDSSPTETALLITASLGVISYVAIQGKSHYDIFLWIFIGVELPDNVVLVSAVQQSESTVCTRTSPLLGVSFPFRSPPSIE